MTPVGHTLRELSWMADGRTRIIGQFVGAIFGGGEQGSSETLPHDEQAFSQMTV